MRFKSRFCRFFAPLVALAAAASPVAAQSSDIPAWLGQHVGDNEGQISPIVLTRAHALYRRKVDDGTVKNACYFAMDATRPNDGGGGHLGRRFYIICDADQSFRAIPAGHGGGRDLDGLADFANGRRCARHFGNAMGSDLTAGGAYVTAEIKSSFKGYYRASARETRPFLRAFVQFDGEGETANARQRAIGGHASETLKGVCLRKDQGSPYADRAGYVPFGTLVDYTGGRSNGCTSWPPSDVPQVMSVLRDGPTTLYIYPEAADIDAVARAVGDGSSLAQSGLYWNAACLDDIRAPKFWPRETLEAIIARFKARHPSPPPQPVPVCRSP